MRRHIAANHEIETVSGLFVDVHSPAPTTIRLEDIAHALSQTCRYGGHCSEFYCVPPETPVLTTGLEWKPAGDLALDDRLFAFEEHPAEVRTGAGCKPRRQIQSATVTHTGTIKRHIVRLDLADGSSVRSSSEHPWLVALKAAGNQSWLAADKILARVQAKRTQTIVRFVDPWKADTSWSAGYLAGMFDAEGHVTTSAGGFAQVGFAQNEGVVLDTVTRYLDDRGFKYRLYPNPQSQTINLTIKGGWQEAARLLGTVRSTRLLQKVTTDIESPRAHGLRATERIEVVGGAVEGLGDVTALSTSTRTYIAGGYGAHNSVAEHAVFVSERLANTRASVAVQLAGLHHDDAEAYLGDIPRPMKPLLGKVYEKLTRRMDGAILVALDLPNIDDDERDLIKRADTWALFVEADHLLPSEGRGWMDKKSVGRIVTPGYWRGGVPVPIATGLYLTRHAELMGRLAAERDGR